MSNDVEYSSQYWPYSSYPAHSQPSLIVPPYSADYPSVSAYPSQAYSSQAYPSNAGSFVASSYGPGASSGFSNGGQQNAQQNGQNGGQRGGLASASSETVPSSNAAASFSRAYSHVGGSVFLVLGALTGVFAFAL